MYIYINFSSGISTVLLHIISILTTRHGGGFSSALTPVANAIQYLRFSDWFDWNRGFRFKFKIEYMYVEIGLSSIYLSYCTITKLQSVYTKSGCRSPNSIQALNPPSPPSSVSLLAAASAAYFWSSFVRTPGRFLTLFLHDKYAMFMGEPTNKMIVLLELGG